MWVLGAQDEFSKLLQRLAPDQAGAVWLFLLVAFTVFGDLGRPLAGRNLALGLLTLPALPMLDIMLWEPHLGDPKLGWLLGAAFTALFAATAFVAAWSLALALRTGPPSPDPNPSEGQLRLLLGLLVLMNLVVVLGRVPEDSGTYTNIGARRWLETGRMPYGDALLRGPAAPGFGASATYGPLLYLAHVPFQFVTGATWNDAAAIPRSPAYVLPPLLATKLTCLAFHLLALWALCAIGRRLRGPRTGLGLACLYAASPAVIGLGGHEALICGLIFISHIAPPAMVLLAVAANRRPFVSGMLLAAAAGVLFFPAFLFPLFFGWHAWRRSGALKFAAGFALVGGLTAAMVVHFTGSLDGRGPVELFLSSTIEHQEGVGAREYGSSRFSFWGTHPDLAAWWQVPLLGTGSTFKPSFLGFAGIAGAAFFLARRRTEAQLAALVALVTSAVQLWKTHAGGTYMAWYLPFVLIALLASSPADGEGEAGAQPAA